MGIFDQVARAAVRVDPDAMIGHLLVPAGEPRSFAAWLDTRSLPLPGGPDRTADLIAQLDGPAERPLLLVVEIQTRPDPDKLGSTLVQAAILYAHARHGDDRQGRFRVLTALIHLSGRCSENVVDMTAGDFGTRHAALVWEIEKDDAVETVEAVAAGRAGVGTLAWVSLMRGGGEDGLISRWLGVLVARCPDAAGDPGPKRRRAEIAYAALTLSQLVPDRTVRWERGLEGFDVTESIIANKMIALGEVRADRKRVLDILAFRFPNEVPDEVTHLINTQNSALLLEHWFNQALRVSSFEQFMDVLRQ